MRMKLERSPYKHLLDDERFKLWLENVERGSVNSASEYLRRIGVVCAQFGVTTESLSKMNEREAGDFLLQIISHFENKGSMGTNIQNYVKGIRSWWNFNDIYVKRRIRIRGGSDYSRYENEKVPSRDELERILNFADIRAKVAISLVAFSGCRMEVLGDRLGEDGLKLGDLPELSLKDGKVELLKIPTMVKVSHVAVLKWIRKYVALMEGYLQKIQPTVSDAWITDEIFVKFSGKMEYVFALMDDETRFWIAQQVAAQKGISDVKPMMFEGARLAGKNPKTLISDGAPNYIEAAKAFSTLGHPINHIREIRLTGKVHNNKMERMNGEIRDREKVMRGLKVEETPILTGMQIYHNFIRPHMALKGKTPAEAAGIKVEGKNKWKTLIQNAAINRNLTEGLA